MAILIRKNVILQMGIKVKGANTIVPFKNFEIDTHGHSDPQKFVLLNESHINILVTEAVAKIPVVQGAKGDKGDATASFVLANDKTYRDMKTELVAHYERYGEHIKNGIDASKVKGEIQTAQIKDANITVAKMDADVFLLSNFDAYHNFTITTFLSFGGGHPNIKYIAHTNDRFTLVGLSHNFKIIWVNKPTLESWIFDVNIEKTNSPMAAKMFAKYFNIYKSTSASARTMIEMEPKQDWDLDVATKKVYDDGIFYLVPFEVNGSNSFVTHSTSYIRGTLVQDKNIIAQNDIKLILGYENDTMTNLSPNKYYDVAYDKAHAELTLTNLFGGLSSGNYKLSLKLGWKKTIPGTGLNRQTHIKWVELNNVNSWFKIQESNTTPKKYGWYNSANDNILSTAKLINSLKKVFRLEVFFTINGDQIEFKAEGHTYDGTPVISSNFGSGVLNDKKIIKLLFGDRLIDEWFLIITQLEGVI